MRASRARARRAARTARNEIEDPLVGGRRPALIKALELLPRAVLPGHLQPGHLQPGHLQPWHLQPWHLQQMSRVLTLGEPSHDPVSRRSEPADCRRLSPIVADCRRLSP
ncbi:MAG: hypothetical protein ABI910_17690, partial [Gemmatimonadota bacterium]